MDSLRNFTIILTALSITLIQSAFSLNHSGSPVSLRKCHSSHKKETDFCLSLKSLASQPILMKAFPCGRFSSGFFRAQVKRQKIVIAPKKAICSRIYFMGQKSQIPKKRKTVLVPQLCPTLCSPMDCRSPGCSSIHGIFQARILECVVISFSRGSS